MFGVFDYVFPGVSPANMYAYRQAVLEHRDEAVIKSATKSVVHEKCLYVAALAFYKLRQLQKAVYILTRFRARRRSSSFNTHCMPLSSSSAMTSSHSSSSMLAIMRICVTRAKSSRTL